MSGTFISAVASVLKQERQRLRIQKEAQRIKEILVREGLDALERLSPRTDELALFEALLASSWALRYDSPTLMLSLAQLAFFKSQNLDARVIGAHPASDLICRAWAELGNAHRVGDKFKEAEWALSNAWHVYEIGTGDKSLEIRLVEIEASLAADQREFKTALFKLERVLEFYRVQEDKHLVGRTLLLKGLYTGYSGKPGEGIDLIQEGFLSIDKDRDSTLVYTAAHNHLLFLIDCRRFKEAKRFRLEFSRELSFMGGRVNEVKLRAVEGRLDSGVGKYQRAESIFREVEAGYKEVGRAYEVAITGLDLSTVLLAQGKAAEAHQVAEKSAKIFLAIKVKPEVMSAVVFLRQAFEMNKATVGLVEKVTNYLRQEDHGPESDFTPEL